MQSGQHVVMTTYKRSIDPGRLQDRELEGSLQELPTLPVANKMVITACEAHRKRGVPIPVFPPPPRPERPDDPNESRVSKSGALSLAADRHKDVIVSCNHCCNL
jgi:hypothetical protein